MTPTVREMLPSDEPALVGLVAEVQRASGYAYPPRYVAPDDDALAVWLRSYEQPGTRRFVAVDEHDVVVGHVAVMPLDDPEFLEAYLREHGRGVDDYVEICKLFASPRTRGVGRRLLEHATEVIAAEGKQALLYVLETGTRAIELYRASGWLELSPILGEPSGIVNHVFVNDGIRAPTPRVHPLAAAVLKRGRLRTAGEYKSAEGP